MTLSIAFKPIASRLRAAVLLSCIALSACATSSVSDNIENSDLLVQEFPPVSASDIAVNTLRDEIKIGDTVEMQVYNIESLSKEYVVDRAGQVNFPLIGRVDVVGLNTSELEQTLTRMYGADYLRDPSINIRVEPRELGKVVVDGAVNRPGVFEVSNVISLSEAIAMAEGLNNETTNGSSIFIVRNVDGTRKVREIDMREVRSFEVAEIDIIPSDVIFVDQSPGRVIFNNILRSNTLIQTGLLFAVR
ncbi:MAG: polysaccharide biosynthesis/export family protein [Litorimonas sp.]